MSTRFLRIFNFGLGFLAADVSSAATTITLQEGDLDAFPAPGTTNPYRVVIDREIMEVTGRNEALNTLTVLRGLEGTTATTHLNLALVTLRLTAAGLLLMQDAINTLEASLGTIQIRVNSGLDVGDRPRLHFVAAANIVITALDSDVNNEVSITIGASGVAGTSGTMTTVKESGTPVGNPNIIVLDFGAGFDITEAPSTEINIALDLSEIAAGGELGGFMDAPTVTGTHSGSAHHALLHAAAQHNAAVLPASANENLGAFYLDIDDIAVPSNPGAGIRRMFVDTATGELSVRTNAGATVSLEEAGVGAPTDAQYYVGAADAGLSAEIVRTKFKEAPFLPGYDEPPTSPDAMDDEFDDASFDAGLWSWIQTEPTISEADGLVTLSGLAASEFIGMVQAIPAGDFDIRCRVSLGVVDELTASSGGRQYIGLATFDGSGDTDDCDFIALRAVHGTAGGITMRKGNVEALDPPAFVTQLTTDVTFQNHAYFRVVLETATYSWYFSSDGIAWVLVDKNTKRTAGAITHIGIILYDNDGNNLQAVVDWFRRYS